MAEVDGDPVVQKITEAERSAAIQFDLSAQHLTLLPSGMSLLLNLERLNLASNLLSTLPADLSKLSRLRYLNLRQNNFREFPAVLSNMIALEILDMSRNKIKKWPTAPGTLLNIRILSVARNRLEDLPRYISDMHDLRMIKCENNPLQWPPQHLLNAPKPGGDSGISPEQAKWLSDLKSYLVDNQKPAASVASTSNTSLQPQESSLTTTFQNTSGVRSGLDCSVLADTFFRRTVPAIDNTPIVTDPIQHFIVTLSFVLSHIHKNLKDLSRSSPALYKSLRPLMEDTNARLCKILNALPKVVLDHVRQVLPGIIHDIRKLLLTIHHNAQKHLSGMDIRLLKHYIGIWDLMFMEIRECVHGLELLFNGEGIEGASTNSEGDAAREFTRGISGLLSSMGPFNFASSLEEQRHSLIELCANAEMQIPDLTSLSAQMDFCEIVKGVVDYCQLAKQEMEEGRFLGDALTLTREKCRDLIALCKDLVD